MDDYTKDFSHLVEIQIANLPTQQVIINGEPQIIEKKQAQITCPMCGRLIVALDQPVTVIEVKQVLTNSAEDFYRIARYCPECGTKLAYERPIVSQQ